MDLRYASVCSFYCILKPYASLGTTSNLSTELRVFLSNPALWTALHPNESCPWIDDFESFGFAQPNVRKAAWGLVQTLLNTLKGPLNHRTSTTFLRLIFRIHLGQLEPIVPVLGFAILRSAWVELDPTVQEIMWQPLLIFLKRMYQLYIFAHESPQNFL